VPRDGGAPQRSRIIASAATHAPSPGLTIERGPFARATSREESAMSLLDVYLLAGMALARQPVRGGA
jgi:hypothetical protein